MIRFLGEFFLNENTSFLCFLGDIRDRVSKIAEELIKIMNKNNAKKRIFYDEYYQAELARPNLDLYLQDIYRYKTRLIVVFMCRDYQRKEWCGLEARVVRDLIKTNQSHRIMLLTVDGEVFDGILSIDGYINIKDNTPDQVANEIYRRLLSHSYPSPGH